jgi:hypothetical protein
MGIDTLRKEDAPTIILFPDAVSLAEIRKSPVFSRPHCLQCADLGDRVGSVSM